VLKVEPGLGVKMGVGGGPVLEGFSTEEAQGGGRCTGMPPAPQGPSSDASPWGPSWWEPALLVWRCTARAPPRGWGSWWGDGGNGELHGGLGARSGGEGGRKAGGSFQEVESGWN